MADIKNITIDGTTYDLKDAKAREDVSDLKEDFTDLPDYGYVPTAGQMMSDNVTVDTEPYSFRATPYGDREIVDAIVGGTVAFNQLYQQYSVASGTVGGVSYTKNNDGSYTFDGTSNAQESITIGTIPRQNGHKYALFGCPSGGGSGKYWLGIGGSLTDVGSGGIYTTELNTTGNVRLDFKSGQTFNNVTVYPHIHDLTQAFGTSVADAIYAMEQSTAGSGVAYLKAVAPKMFAQYNPYNSGELKHVSGLSAHETVGFNVWDEETELGYIDPTTGVADNSTNKIRMKNYMPVLPNTTYYKKAPVAFWNVYFDADKNYIGYGNAGINEAFVTPKNCHYIRSGFEQSYGTTYNHDICINLSDPTRNGEYQPYVKHSYALDDSLTLMGVPKWVDGKLTFHGDIYPPSGGVGRRYGIVDLGTLTWVVGATGVADRSRFNSSSVSSTMKIVTGGKVANVITTKYQTVSGDYGWTNDVDKLLWIDLYGAVNIVDSAYSTPADFKTAMSGVYLVYEKATQTTETAEPYQQIQVCPNGGTEEYISTSIVPVGHSTRYPENSRMKLDGLPWDFSTLIAPVEKTYVATRNYTTGQLLIVNNLLYKVTANIANGGTITPNTNVTATTLSEVIASL